jgi:hypothetical protein
VSDKNPFARTPSSSGTLYARLGTLAAVAAGLAMLYFVWGPGRRAAAPATAGLTGGAASAAAGGAAPGPGAAVAGPGSGGATPGARGAGATGGPPGSGGTRKLTKEERSKLAALIEGARTLRLRGGPTGTPTGTELDKDYIRSRVAELKPMLRDCYEDAVRTAPGLNGKLVVEFLISGEPGAGGMIESSKILDESTIDDAGLRECVRETMYALELPAPPEGGSVVVHYPFLFSSGADDAAGGGAPPAGSGAGTATGGSPATAAKSPSTAAP